MNSKVQQKLLSVLNDVIEPLHEPGNYKSLLEKIHDARFVMLGEATHGTHEFYQARIDMTRELITQHGFMAVAIEGDWTDAYKVHCYIQGRIYSHNEFSALEDFKRFPNWMWRNETLLPFVRWLRTYNDSYPQQKVGFYGLDLYGMQASIQAVIRYLMKVDPKAAKEAKNRYACFDHTVVDPQLYGFLASQNAKSCVEEVVQGLKELQQNSFKYTSIDGKSAADDYFFAEQNARIVKNAEAYYKAMFKGHIDSWNIRDRHMAEMIQNLDHHLTQRFQKPAKIVIWAHNSHLGDARATEMGERGEVNLGQLLRQHYRHETYSVGFSTYSGFVTAADNWDEPAKCKAISPGFKESYEELFHKLNHADFILHLKHNKELEHYLKLPRLQRAIGVIYRPETERYSHYFFTNLPLQFDSMIHFDNTNAVQPLE